MNLAAEFMKPDGGPAFERLMSKVCGKLFNVKFSLFGRNGQEQYGIDLYTSGFRICVQCKNYSDYGKLKSQMQKDFHDAISRFDNMEQYILATTLQRDTGTQELADKLWCSLPEEQRNHVKFEILFWDDIWKCLKENTEYLDNDNIFALSQYDRACPDPEKARLWWMGTSQNQGWLLINNTPRNEIGIGTRRLSIRSLHRPKDTSYSEQNQEFEWIDQLEAMPDHYSEIQWLDDLRPVLLGPLFVCTLGRGIFFLISNWDHGLTDSINRYAVNILDEAQSFVDKGFGWVEIKPEDYKHLCDKHSGTIIEIDERCDDVQKLISCVQRWNELGQKGQLIFHIHGNLSSYNQWMELEHRSRYYIQNLRSTFGKVPISLLTAYHPFRPLQLLTLPTTPPEFPKKERPADWIRKNPDRLPDILCGFEKDEDQLIQWLPALSGWPDVLETVFASMAEKEDVQYLLNELNLNYEMCAIALYRLYQGNASWNRLLQECLEKCPGRVERTFQYLLNPDGSKPEDIDDVLYTLLCCDCADFLGITGQILQLLNGQRRLADVAQSNNGLDYLKQLGSILLPENDQYADETIKNLRGLIRPYI